MENKNMNIKLMQHNGSALGCIRIYGIDELEYRLPVCLFKSLTVSRRKLNISRRNHSYNYLQLRESDVSPEEKQLVDMLKCLKC